MTEQNAAPPRGGVFLYKSVGLNAEHALNRSSSARFSSRIEFCSLIFVYLKHIPMKYFTKRLYTSAGYAEFIFNRTATAGAPRYHVSVRHGESKALLFTMEEKETGWGILNTPNLPAWIWESEKVLSEEIDRHCVAV